MIIDPPVTPYHTPAEIQDWIAELQAMRVDADGAWLRDIDAAIAEAEEWLRVAANVPD